MVSSTMLTTCGDTEIATANIMIAIGKLARTTQPGNVTEFGAQFEVTKPCMPSGVLAWFMLFGNFLKLLRNSIVVPLQGIVTSSD